MMPFDYENGFYQTASPHRIAKFLAHYELFKISSGIPGIIVECGVFKGCSLLRFAAFRRLLGLEQERCLVAFDMFGKFPADTVAQDDQAALDKFLAEAGDEGVNISELMDILARAGNYQNITLMPGDVLETVPEFCEANQSAYISMLNVDVDLYEPTQVVLEYLYPLVMPGGVVLLDDYKAMKGYTGNR